jgi:hypothetical protein
MSVREAPHSGEADDFQRDFSTYNSVSFCRACSSGESVMSDDVLIFAGGVASLGSGLVCLEISESHLQCIELSTGTVVSTIPGTSFRPLTWIQGKLIGWQPDLIERHVVRPVVAEVTSDIASVVTLPPLTLPDWVDAQGTDADRFFLEATEEDHNVVFRWRARAEYDGGAPPPREVLEASRHSSHGTAVYDIETKELLRSEISGEEAALVQEEGQADVLDPPQGTYRIPYRKGMTIQSDPWTVDGKAMAIWPQADGGTPGLSLVHSPAGAGERARVTAQQLTKHDIYPAKVEVHISADGRHIFVGVQEGEGTPRWQVFDADANYLGSIPREHGTRDIAKTENQVIYIVDKIEAAEDGNRRKRQLKALDFASGALLWSLPVFDRIERPAPPRPPGNF